MAISEALQEYQRLWKQQASWDDLEEEIESKNSILPLRSLASSFYSAYQYLMGMERSSVSNDGNGY